MGAPDFSSLAGLVRLIYASRWNQPRGLVLRDEVRKIMMASMANNRRQDVTGLLLIHEGYFIQALEGPAASVEAVYRKVAADPRHETVTLLQLGSAPSRLFRDWNMTARQLSSADTALLRATGQQKFDPFTLDGADALKLLTGVGQAYVY